MSTNKNKVRSPRQSPNPTRIQELEMRIENLKDDLAHAGAEKVNLRHQVESLSLSLGQERLFWYYMVANFRFHHARAAVLSTSDSADERKEVRDSVFRATLDLLMAPSDPSSSFTKNWHQDHKLHRVMAGPENELEASRLPARRLVNASEI